MTVVYAINIADRYVVSTLIEPIKLDLALSDSAVGFLTGVALAIFYVSAGIPLGVLADRTNRRNMIAWSVAAWSAMMVWCGLSQNFIQLLIGRIGVGIGEAGGTPPSQSIIADKFLPGARAAAMSIFAVGAAAGSALGSAAGGALADHVGWRNSLLLFGLVGLPVALLVRFTVREPPRGQLDTHPQNATAVSLRDTLRFMRSQNSVIHLLAGAGILTFWGWGLLWWTPAFLARSHGLSTGQAGALLAPMHGAGGAAVMVATAWLLSRPAWRDPRRQTWFVALTTLLACVPSIVVYATGLFSIATAMLWIFVPVTYLYIGPTSGLLQNLVSAHMRAQAFAILLFVANFANLVVAPQLIGVASDLIRPHIADPQQSLRYALMASAITGLWAAYHYYAAAKEMRRGIERARTFVTFEPT